MPKIVISDASCLIVLDKINELNILKGIYSEVITTPEVKSEFRNSLPDWIRILSPKASAIALGVETEDCVVILDDLKARRIAETLTLILPEH